MGMNKLKGQKQTITLTRLVNWPERIPAWAFMLIVAAITAPMLWLSFNVLLNGTWDNYRYLNLGRALYEARGFVQIDVPSYPPETTISPGYPFLISIIMKAAGHARPIIAIKAINSLCFFFSTLLGAWIFIRYFSINRWVAALFAVYLVTNVATSAFASIIFTHSPYILFSTLTLLAFLSYAENQRIGSFVIAILFTVIAIYIRFPGLPLAVAGFVWLVFRREYKMALIYGGAVSILLSFWVLPLILSNDFGYTQQLTATGCDYPSKAYPSLAQRYFHHFFGYIYYHIPNHLVAGLGASLDWSLNFKTIMSAPFAKIMVRIAIAGLAIFGIITRIRDKKIGIVLFFVAIYFLMIPAASSYWGRYVNYLLPWIFLACALGIQRIFEITRLGTGTRAVLCLLIFAFVFACNTPNYIDRVYFTQFHRKQLAQFNKKQMTRPYKKGAAPAQLFLVSRTWGTAEPCKVIAAYHWCQDNLPKDAVLVGCQTALGCFHAERPVMQLPFWWCKQKWDHPKAVYPEANEWLWREVLKKNTTHVVMNLDDVSDFCGHHMVIAVNAFDECFTPVFRFGDNPVNAVVLEINRPLLKKTLIDRGVEDMGSVPKELAGL